MFDTATVSGRVDPVGGPTIRFRLYGPDDAACTGPPVFAPPGVPYPVEGGPVMSAPFTPASAGMYRWIATYSGDANNSMVAGACNDAGEATVIAKASPSITTTASHTNAETGDALSDRATVRGLVNPPPGTVVVFNLFGPNDVSCSSAPVFAASVSYPAGAGEVISPAFAPTESGTYRWVAFYPGDANNHEVNGSCGDPSETTDVRAVLPGPIDADGDGSTLGFDCNDNNAAIHPGAVDKPGNAIDENCDGQDAPYPLLPSRVDYRFDYAPRHTRVRLLAVRQVVGGTTIAVTCSGRGCPLTSRTRLTRTSVRKVNLLPLLRDARLRPGATLEVRATKPDTIGIALRFRMRSDKPPRVTGLCIPAGRRRPGRCAVLTQATFGIAKRAEGCCGRNAVRRVPAAGVAFGKWPKIGALP